MTGDGIAEVADGKQAVSLPRKVAVSGTCVTVAVEVVAHSRRGASTRILNSSAPNPRRVRNGVVDSPGLRCARGARAPRGPQTQRVRRRVDGRWHQAASRGADSRPSSLISPGVTATEPFRLPRRRRRISLCRQIRPVSQSSASQMRRLGCTTVIVPSTDFAREGHAPRTSPSQRRRRAFPEF
jgi:hypothetical protein